MADNQFIKIMNLRHPRHLRLKNQTDKLSFNEKIISKKLFFQFLSKFASYLCSTKRKQHLIIHT